MRSAPSDFDKWVDEDEQDAAEDPAAGDLDMSGGMPGMGMPGMGGMGGMMGGGAGGAPGGFDMEALSKFGCFLRCGVPR